MSEQIVITTCAHCTEEEYQSIRGIPLCKEHYYEALEHGAHIDLPLPYLFILHQLALKIDEKRKVKVIYAPVDKRRNWSIDDSPEIIGLGFEEPSEACGEPVDKNKLRDVDDGSHVVRTDIAVVAGRG